MRGWQIKMSQRLRRILARQKGMTDAAWP